MSLLYPYYYQISTIFFPECDGSVTGVSKEGQYRLEAGRNEQEVRGKNNVGGTGASVLENIIPKFHDQRYSFLVD